MNVPVRLARRDAAAPAANAFLLPAADAGPLAAAVARLGAAAVYRVAGGFLVVPPGPTADRLPGAVRLRRLRGDLFVPVDADLLPALLPDEQTALTRDVGLVALPGGEVRAFAPDRPLTPADWLAVPAVRRGPWRPFPPRPDRPDRLTAIERPTDPTAAVEVLSAGRPPDAAPLGGPGEAGPVPEDARPPAAGAAARLAAGAGMAAAGFLAWLGRAFGAPGLARRGADLARRAVERVPRLTERLLGAQEAALREVLRQLQSGDVEKALRRAPVAVPDPGAPGRVGTGADLTPRDPRYSLRDLLGGGGPGSVWLGGGDVWARLAAEYRRLAAEAVRRGDYRRAAYLHGVLLRDVRAAAGVLMQGGLYRDAGVLYRDRLADLPPAARAFERAGDHDEAVRLYVRAGLDEAAGDLLARLGEPDRAADLYARAADRLAGRGHWVAAGDLLRTKAGDAAAARGFYARGWEGGGAEAVACGERLLDCHLVAEDWPAVRRLFDAAEATLAPPRTADAGKFFTYARTVGEDFLPSEMRADLADRTRLLFAAHVRAAADPDCTARELFGPAGKWPGPVARDAAYAARRPGRVAEVCGHPPPVPLADGTTQAVAVAWVNFDVVLATTAAVVVWRPNAGRVEPVCPTGGRTVYGLSTDWEGQRVFVLLADGDDLVLRCFTADGGRFEPAGQRLFPGAVAGPQWYLQPAAMLRAGEVYLTLAGPDGRYHLLGTLLRDDPALVFAPDGHPTHLLADGGAGYTWDWDERFLRCRHASGAVVGRWLPRWTPAVPVGSPLTVPPLDWTAPEKRLLEVAGTDRGGVLHWAAWDARAGADPAERSAALDHADRFRAACLAGPGQVVAATGRNEILWLRPAGGRLAPRAARPLAVPARVAALVARPSAGEVVAVLDDGSAVRLPAPGRGADR